MHEFNIVEPFQQQELWSKDLNIQSVVDWKEIYKTNCLFLIEKKLRYFPVKLNLRLVVTDIQLYGFGLIESENCKFRNKAPETILHLFCTCPVAITLWKNVSACLSSFLKDSFSFNNFNKVFGVPNKNNTERNVYLLNCLLLSERFVIYRSKYGNRIPAASEFYQQM